MKEYLIALNELFSGPEKWTQKMFAQRADKTFCFSDDEDATCFCLDGGIRRIIPLSFQDGVREQLIKAAGKEPNELGCISSSIYIINDTSSFEQIKEILTKAIEAQ